MISSTEREEIIAAVDKINEELYIKYNKLNMLEYTPIVSYAFGGVYSNISISIASKLNLPEISIWFSEQDDRIFYEKSNKYEAFYSYIKRKFRLIKNEINRTII